MPSQKIESGHQDTVHDVAMDYYGKRLATASSDNTIKIIGKEGTQNEWSQAHVFDDHKSSVNCVAWAPYELGLCLACGSSDGNISVFTAKSDGGKVGDQWDGKVLKNFGAPVWRVSWSLTGNILAVADGTNNVTLWKEAVDGDSGSR
ncbi:hypothetical protein RJ639_021001 [Escallonia herrerae]|uniref:Uncharacterized protein n=1 Tax=Escallonia herrerae TaxID=1293975 RepID=A0AA88V7U8_9ASTE|nr:hypothetical protein RJ639_021001 [Escallonia herrerae]